MSFVQLYKFVCCLISAPCWYYHLNRLWWNVEKSNTNKTQPKIAYERVDKFLHLVTNDECWKCISQIFLSSEHVAYTWNIGMVEEGKYSHANRTVLDSLALPYTLPSSCILLDLMLILYKYISAHASWLATSDLCPWHACYWPFVNCPSRNRFTI